MARIAYSILYREDAIADLRQLRAYDARWIVTMIERELTYEPTRPSRRRKLLAGLVAPWDTEEPIWELRVGDFRVFYDVDVRQVEVRIAAIRGKGSRTTEEIL